MGIRIDQSFGDDDIEYGNRRNKRVRISEINSNGPSIFSPTSEYAPSSSSNVHTSPVMPSVTETLPIHSWRRDPELASQLRPLTRDYESFGTLRRRNAIRRRRLQNFNFATEFDPERNLFFYDALPSHQAWLSSEDVTTGLDPPHLPFANDVDEVNDQEHITRMTTASSHSQQRPSAIRTTSDPRIGIRPRSRARSRLFFDPIHGAGLLNSLMASNLLTDYTNDYENGNENDEDDNDDDDDNDNDDDDDDDDDNNNGGYNNHSDNNAPSAIPGYPFSTGLAAMVADEDNTRNSQSSSTSSSFVSSRQLSAPVSPRSEASDSMSGVHDTSASAGAGTGIGGEKISLPHIDSLICGNDQQYFHPRDEAMLKSKAEQMSIMQFGQPMASGVLQERKKKAVKRRQQKVEGVDDEAEVLSVKRFKKNSEF